MFFVLSGYLITSLLVQEVEETGTLNLFRFYARRARRLLPAAVLLLVCVSAFAFVFYAPLEQVDLAKTTLASAAYVSNIFFGLRATDYLAADAETNPLLHTWSLSVEEQFYLVWPALVLGLLVGFNLLHSGRRPNRQRLIWGMASVAAASFALTLVLTATGQTHWAFFSSPTRVWEFALGGLGALIPRGAFIQKMFGRKGARAALLTSTLGWVGLAAVLFAGSFYTARTPFPGWAALLPVLGTVLILRAGTSSTKTWLAQTLSWHPLRIFGRLSYSWYLWHWPALVFASGFYDDLTLVQRLIVVTLSLGLAGLSYWLVENPVRRNRTLKRTRHGWALLGILALFSLSLSASWWGVAAAQLRSPEQKKYANVDEDKPQFSDWRCVVQRMGTRLAGCGEGPADAPFTAALFGDSHAAQWAPALQAIAAERGWRLLYFMKVGCPALDLTLYAPSMGRDYTECDVWRDAALEELREVHPDLIVVSSFSHYGVLDRGDWKTGSEAILDDLSAAAENVAIIRDTPLPGADVPACLSRRAWRETLGLSSGTSCDFPAHNSKDIAVFEAQTEAANSFNNVDVIDLTSYICPEDVCIAETEERLLVRDINHLTASYVRSLSDALEQALSANMKGDTAHSPRAPR